jgi:hypothetical protein
MNRTIITAAGQASSIVAVRPGERLTYGTTASAAATFALQARVGHDAWDTIATWSAPRTHEYRNTTGSVASYRVVCTSLAALASAVIDVSLYDQVLQESVDGDGQVTQTVRQSGVTATRVTAPAAVRAPGSLAAQSDTAFYDDDMTAAALELDATETSDGLPRKIKITHASVGTTDTLGSITVTGLDENGELDSETIALVADDTVETTGWFSRLITVRTPAWVIDGVEETEDTLEIGFGDEVLVRTDVDIVELTALDDHELHLTDGTRDGQMLTLRITQGTGGTHAWTLDTDNVTYTDVVANLTDVDTTEGSEAVLLLQWHVGRAKWLVVGLVQVIVTP